MGEAKKFFLPFLVVRGGKAFFSPAWQQLGGCRGPKGGKKGDLELIRACNNLFRGGEKSCAFSSETVMLEKTFRGYT